MTSCVSDLRVRALFAVLPDLLVVLVAIVLVYEVLAGFTRQGCWPHLPCVVIYTRLSRHPAATQMPKPSDCD